MNDLDAHLERLATQLPAPAGHEDAQLVALVPCEPAIGPVALACWTHGDADETVQLVRLADGSPVNDDVALRESITLLAMVETVEELATFDQLAGIASALAAWTVEGGAPLPDAYRAARDAALGALDGLAARAPALQQSRVARVEQLDAIGGALRELERTWEALEQQAELWSDAHLAALEQSAAAVEQVQSLWRVLAAARRGPLARPVSTALHDGREAGAAMAAAVLESRAAPAQGAAVSGAAVSGAAAPGTAASDAGAN